MKFSFVHFVCSSARLRRLLSNGLFELSRVLMCICKLMKQSISVYFFEETILHKLNKPDHNQLAWWPVIESFLPVLRAKCLHPLAKRGQYAMVSVVQLCIAIFSKQKHINCKYRFEHWRKLSCFYSPQSIGSS